MAEDFDVEALLEAPVDGRKVIINFYIYIVNIVIYPISIWL